VLQFMDDGAPQICVPGARVRGQDDHRRRVPKVSGDATPSCSSTSTGRFRPASAASDWTPSYVSRDSRPVRRR
jgi:hypothetical protein